MKGILLKNSNSKICSEGRTYDSKLYTFQENNHRKLWLNLEIDVKKLNKKNCWKNIPTDRAQQEEKLDFENPNDFNQVPILGS